MKEKKEVGSQLDPDMGRTKKNCLCMECVTCISFALDSIVT